MKKIGFIIVLLMICLTGYSKGSFKIGFDVGCNMNINPFNKLYTSKTPRESSNDYFVYGYHSLQAQPNTSLIFLVNDGFLMRVNGGVNILFHEVKVIAYPTMGLSFGYLFTIF